ncbi:MAG TPA: prephenate dehydratase [Mycobacteriales bacterium]|nr:prephenate dehydratase [Mycobacteriales bacterium]
MTRYAYLGPEGTFAEAALRTIPEVAQGTTLPQRTVPAAIQAVRAGVADAAVVPIENSIEGSVASTLDELGTGEPLQIAREILLPVTFSLLVRAGTEADAVKTVATHPHAEAQTRRWLRDHLPAAEVVFTGSTAGAAMAVGQGEYDAAVAAPIAGVRAGLEPLAEDIADNPGAVTRFVLLTRPGRPPVPTGLDKTSLVAFIRDDHTGALLEVLTEFAVRGVNLTRIESRPTGEQLGRYCFSIDCEGHVADARVGDALAALHRICADVRFLGSYPRSGPGQNMPMPPGRDDAAFADAAAWLKKLTG